MTCVSSEDAKAKNSGRKYRANALCTEFETSLSKEDRCCCQSLQSTHFSFGKSIFMTLYAYHLSTYFTKWQIEKRHKTF